MNLVYLEVLVDLANQMFLVNLAILVNLVDQVNLVEHLGSLLRSY